MIQRILIFALVVGVLCSCHESADSTGTGVAQSTAHPATFTLTDEKVLIGCGKCQFQMIGIESCAGALRIDDDAVLITSVPNTDHVHGLCEKAIPAIVSGTIEAGEANLTEIEFQ